MKKNRSRPISSYARKGSSQSGNIILIISEGEKTEPNYFRGLRDKWKLAATDVEVIGAGATPSTVVKAAIERQKYRKDNRKPPYDAVWCVVDKDAHTDMETARNSIKKKKGFHLVLSTPCFEIWYLLHFQFSTKPYNSFAELLPDLKKCLPEYGKADDYTAFLLDRLETALTNAKKLRQHHQQSGTDNPYTDVDLVINALKNKNIGRYTAVTADE